MKQLLHSIGDPPARVISFTGFSFLQVPQMPRPKSLRLTSSAVLFLSKMLHPVLYSPKNGSSAQKTPIRICGEEEVKLGAFYVLSVMVFATPYTLFNAKKLTSDIFSCVIVCHNILGSRYLHMPTTVLSMRLTAPFTLATSN